MAFYQWAFDYLNLMVPPLENFIGKSPQKCLQRTNTTPERTVSYIDLAFSVLDLPVSTSDLAILQTHYGYISPVPFHVEHYVPTVGGEISRRQQQLPLIVNHVINASMCDH